MRAWFIHYYEDPVENTPYESAEGGYLYIWGGPYDTLEQLESEFGGAIAFDRIQEAAHELEADGTTDRAPSSFHPDRERVEEEDIDAERTLSPEPDLEQIIARLQAGVRPSYGDASEMGQRRLVLDQLEAVERALERLQPTRAGIGHNRPPQDDNEEDEPNEGDAKEAVAAIRDAMQNAEPDALVVAIATSRLANFAGWISKKVDKTADKFFETLGASAAAAAVLAAVRKWEFVQQAVHGLVQVTTHWLEAVTQLFCSASGPHCMECHAVMAMNSCFGS